MKKVGVQERLDAYLKLLKVIERKTCDRQAAAVVFAELARDIRAGLVWQASDRADKRKANNEEETVTVKLPPRIPR